MGTPKALPKEHAHAPVKYDVEEGGSDIKSFSKEMKKVGVDDVPADDKNIQVKDWDTDEDKEILESIKYAENKLGAKMATPHVLPKEHAHAPIKYDVEELTQKDIKAIHKFTSNIEKEKGSDAGDCDIDDHEC